MPDPPLSALPFGGLLGLPSTFALKFTGANTNSFLRQFELLYNAQGIADSKKTEALPLYLNAEYSDEVCEWEEYKTKNWEGVKTKMLATFNDEDVNRYTVRDLKNVAERQAEKGLRSVLQLKGYHRRFVKISKWLKKKEKIAWQEESRIYLRPVQRSLRKEWEREKRQERRAAKKSGQAGGGELSKVEDIFSDLKAILEDQEAYGEGEGGDDDSSEEGSDDEGKSDATTDYDTANEEGGEEEEEEEEEGEREKESKRKGKGGDEGKGKSVRFKKEEKGGGGKGEKGQGREAKEVSKTEQDVKHLADLVAAASKPTASALEELTQKFSEWTIGMTQLLPAATSNSYNRSYPAAVAPAQANAATFPAREPPPHAYGSNVAAFAAVRPPTGAGGGLTCFTCRGAHSFRDIERCEALKDFIKRGIVTVTGNGTYVHRGTRFPLSFELPASTPTFADWVNARERQFSNGDSSAGGGGGTYATSVGRYTFNLAGNPLETKVGEFFGPEEDGVYDVDAGKRGRGEGSVSEGGGERKRMDTRSEVQRRQEQGERIVEEGGGRGDPVGNEGGKSVAAEQDEAMTDATSRRKKSTTTLRSTVEGRITKAEVVNELFSSTVTLTLEQLLACAPELAKTVIAQCQRKRVPIPAEGEVLTYQGEHVLLPDGNEVHAALGGSNSIYSAPLGRLGVEIGGEEVKGLVDSGSMITVMGSDLRQRLGLTLSQSSGHNLSGINGDSVKLAGICKNVPISVGGVVTRHHIFISPHARTGLILGVPFLRALKGSLSYSNAGEPTLRLTVNGVVSEAILQTDGEIVRRMKEDQKRVWGEGEGEEAWGN